MPSSAAYFSPFLYINMGVFVYVISWDAECIIRIIFALSTVVSIADIVVVAISTDTTALLYSEKKISQNCTEIMHS